GAARPQGRSRPGPGGRGRREHRDARLRVIRFAGSRSGVLHRRADSHSANINAGRMGVAILKNTKLKPTFNPQTGRIGKITDDERGPPAGPYANPAGPSLAAGCAVEPFYRYLIEWVENERAPAIEPLGVDLSQPRRDYEQMFVGLRGFDVP